MPGDTSVADILRRYDFIGTTERFAESMLLLKDKLPMAVSLRDILYLKCKDSTTGKSIKEGLRGHEVYKTLARHKPYAEQSQRVRDFFDSNDFKNNNYMDSGIWDSANNELDIQAKAYGRKRLQRESNEYQKKLIDVKMKCQALTGDTNNPDLDCEGPRVRKCMDRVASIF